MCRQGRCLQLPGRHRHGLARPHIPMPCAETTSVRWQKPASTQVAPPTRPPQPAAAQPTCADQAQAPGAQAQEPCSDSGPFADLPPELLGRVAAAGCSPSAALAFAGVCRQAVTMLATCAQLPSAPALTLAPCRAWRKALLSSPELKLLPVASMVPNVLGARLRSMTVPSFIHQVWVAPGAASTGMSSRGQLSGRSGLLQAARLGNVQASVAAAVALDMLQRPPDAMHYWARAARGGHAPAMVRLWCCASASCHALAQECPCSSTGPGQLAGTTHQPCCACGAM